MKPDAREAKIIMQNALAHATKIMIHNSPGKEINVDDVIKLAKHIAIEVIKIGTPK